MNSKMKLLDTGRHRKVVNVIKNKHHGTNKRVASILKIFFMIDILIAIFFIFMR